jgi:exopolyphosphatase/guanosine-5'-triphosphate,3'-diphosphate pyrophosphatase
MALRSAKNTNDFIKQVAEQCGIKIKIIDGEEEARLSFLAVTSSISIPNGDFMIFDIGGGSTEFIFVRANISKIKSV